MDLRLRLLGARSEEEFKQLMWEHMKELAEEQCDENVKRKLSDDADCKVDELTSSVRCLLWWLDARQRWLKYLG